MKARRRKDNVKDEWAEDRKPKNIVMADPVGPALSNITPSMVVAA